MQKQTAVNIKAILILAILMIVDLPAFASGHLPDPMPILAILVCLLSLAVTVISTLLYLVARKKWLRIIVWVFSLITLCSDFAFVSFAEINLFSFSAKGGPNIFVFLPILIMAGCLLAVSLLEPIIKTTPSDNEQADAIIPDWIKNFSLFIYLVYGFRIVKQLFILFTFLSFKLGWSTSINVNIRMPAGQIFTWISAGLLFIYGPAIIYFMNKRSKWCWVLLFMDSIFYGVSILESPYVFGHYRSNGLFINGGWIPVVFEILLVVFIWHKGVAAYLNITSTEKQKYAIWVGSISFALLLLTGIGKLLLGL